MCLPSRAVANGSIDEVARKTSWDAVSFAVSASRADAASPDVVFGVSVRLCVVVAFVVPLVGSFYVILSCKSILTSCV